MLCNSNSAKHFSMRIDKRLGETFMIMKMEKNEATHCVKSVRIRSFSGLYFPTFRLNGDRYSVSLRIQSECEKIRTRKTPNTDTFHVVTIF